ncbi:MAG: aminotransferase class III-fold pyridoxal phosphate-dependent enzyme [Rectinema subterraneum]|jgi:glutamate-1-semialdehyde 2,1-aminomutase
MSGEMGNGPGEQSEGPSKAKQGQSRAEKRFETSIAYFERAAKVIPGGIYGSKSPGFLVPGHFPYYLSHAKGSRIVDVDGNEFIDYLCGYGSQIVGYGNPAVDEPALAQARKGDLLNQPHPVMVELAERLVGLVDGMDWAVFVKNGTDATTLATSIARADTGKQIIIAAEGAYHGAANWCSTNVFPVFTQAEQRDVRYFPYNDVAALEALFRQHREKIACVILTPYHHPTYKPQQLPTPEFIATVERLCHSEGAYFIMDDIRANFRLSMKGSHSFFGAHPEMITMGKALANGYPLSVLLGTEGLKKTASSFFITGTYWMSAVPMIAAMATLDEMERLGGTERLAQLGRMLKEGLESLGREAGFSARISGPLAIPYLTFDEDPDLFLNQRFCAAMADRGVFMHPHHNWFISLAHTEEDIAQTLEAARGAFAELRD